MLRVQKTWPRILEIIFFYKFETQIQILFSPYSKRTMSARNVEWIIHSVK